MIWMAASRLATSARRLTADFYTYAGVALREAPPINWLVLSSAEVTAESAAPSVPWKCHCRVAAISLFVMSTLFGGPAVGGDTGPKLLEKKLSPEEELVRTLTEIANEITWTNLAFADNNAPFVIGFLGTEANIGGSVKISLERINFGNISGRLSRVESFPGFDELLKSGKQCHLIYIFYSQNVKNDRKKIKDLKKIAKFALTVSPIPSFRAYGGAIAIDEGDYSLSLKYVPPGLTLSDKLKAKAKD